MEVDNSGATRCTDWTDRLTVRAANVLHDAGLTSAEAVLATSDYAILRMRNAGRRVLNELRARGLRPDSCPEPGCWLPAGHDQQHLTWTNGAAPTWTNGAAPYRARPPLASPPLAWPPERCSFDGSDCHVRPPPVEDLRCTADLSTERWWLPFGTGRCLAVGWMRWWASLDGCARIVDSCGSVA